MLASSRYSSASHKPKVISRHIHLYREDNAMEDNLAMINAPAIENIKKHIDLVLEKRRDP